MNSAAAGEAELRSKNLAADTAATTEACRADAQGVSKAAGIESNWHSSTQWAAADIDTNCS